MTTCEFTTLLNRIESIVKQKNISEISVLPSGIGVEDIVTEGNQLGIPKAVLKRHGLQLYQKAKNSDPHSIENGPFSYLFIALLMFPNVPLFWKKWYLSYSPNLESPKSALHLMKLIIKLHPKCPRVYSQSYRLMKDTSLSVDHKLVLMDDAMLIATIGAERYPNNYYAWTYRQTLLQLHTSLHEAVDSVLNKELTWIRKWREMHVSDHSCYHYSQFVISQLSSERVIEELKHEYKDICSLITYYPEHEALYYHKRWVVWKIRSLLQQSDNSRLESILTTEQINCKEFLVSKTDSSTSLHEKKYCQYVARFLQKNEHSTS